jgi:flagellar biosynthetic protein FlhB
MQADVARAAVVITNPTHYAVALAFDFETMDAPKVLAKGRNLLAEEIKDQARWGGVPILENPPLARSLYRSVEIGQSIPVDLYAAVASILAYLYRQRVEQELRERRAQGRAAGNRGPVSASSPQEDRQRGQRSPSHSGMAVIPALDPSGPRNANAMRAGQQAAPDATGAKSPPAPN